MIDKLTQRDLDVIKDFTAFLDLDLDCIKRECTECLAENICRAGKYMDCQVELYEKFINNNRSLIKKVEVKNDQEIDKKSD